MYLRKRIKRVASKATCIWRRLPRRASSRSWSPSE
jgi:hypothetical protein